MWDTPMHYYGFPGGGLMMIFFWALLVVAVIALIRWASRADTDTKDRAPSAEEILKKRYASGEISKEEYEQMKKDLT